MLAEHTQAANAVTNQFKPVLDEQTFEKLLEAAFVVQEHNRKMRGLEESLKSQGEQMYKQELAEQALLQRSKPGSGDISAHSDYTLILAEIVEAQQQIQMRHLELDKAMAVVAERVVRITSASGAGLGIVEGATVHYLAGAGSQALPAGTEVRRDRAICQASVSTGKVIRIADVNAEFQFDAERCRQRGIRSFIAVPIYRDGHVVGALELYFDRTRGFVEQDIHTCQLMAGLVTEAIGRDSESKLKTSMAAERSTMLAAIEKLQPNLTAWAEDKFGASPKARTAASVPAETKIPCWKCGSNVMKEEQFCGKCGAPRTGDAEESTVQSKVASAWHTQQANQQVNQPPLNLPPVNLPPVNLPPLNLHQANQHTASAIPPANGTSAIGEHSEQMLFEDPFEIDASLESMTDHFLKSFPPPELEEDATEEGGIQTERPFTPSEEDDSFTESLASEPEHGEEDVEALPSALVRSPREDLIWSSAAKAQDFLESLKATQTSTSLARFWRFRRGDLYLAVAVILVVIVLGWGLWSNHSAGAASRSTAVASRANRKKRPPPEPDLSTFDKLLIGLGLAEPPEAPEYKGNPDAQVWVDLNTALYYCPGSDLYEKTAKGKISSQRDAQLDQFEPASRKACD